MAELAVTIMDVGWGDSILVDATDDAGDRRFGLVDCNDYSRQTVAKALVKRYFERAGIDWKHNKPNLEWVLLTHGHADHARGLKEMMKTFGTRNFWYPKSVRPGTTYGTLLTFANSSSNVEEHQSVDESKIIGPPEVTFAAEIDVLWPDHDDVHAEENDNSVVLALTLGSVSIVLTGDALAHNWSTIAGRIPTTVAAFQTPHHGALNGTFDGAATPWLTALNSAATEIVMSSHTVPHGHPHQDVIDELDDGNFRTYRTDRHYHVTMRTDGTDLDVQYSHVSGNAP